MPDPLAILPAADAPPGHDHYWRLRALKEKHQLTWSQLSALIDLSTSSIANMKSGKQGALTATRVTRLAELEAAEHVSLPAPRPARAPRTPLVPDAPGKPVALPPAPKAATPDSVATEALDILAARYRDDVTFLLAVICRANAYKFNRAINQAPAAAVDDLRTHEGVHLLEFSDTAFGPAAAVVKKLIGAA